MDVNGETLKTFEEDLEKDFEVIANAYKKQEAMKQLEIHVSD
jgi:hypothetical protein